MDRKKAAEGKSPTSKSSHGRRKADAGPEGRTIKEKAASKKAARHRQSAPKGEPKSLTIKKRAERKPDVNVGHNSFPIVGIGASAGGLEAFTRLLKQLPADTGMGFVLVQHLDPVHESALTKLLSKATSMPVREVTNNTRVEPNRVYVIPPNTSLVIAEGILKLLPRKKTDGQHRPIDYFYQSLAEDQRERAISVILSGTASDGTLDARQSSPRAESRLLRMIQPSMTACRGVRLRPAVLILCCHRKTLRENSRASRDIHTFGLISRMSQLASKTLKRVLVRLLNIRAEKLPARKKIPSKGFCYC